MTPDDLTADLQRLRELEARATPGPWKATHKTTFGGGEIGFADISGPATGRYGGVEYRCSSTNADADFVAALRNAAPALIAAAEERDRLRSELTDVMRVLQKHQPSGSPPPGNGYCLAVWIMDTLREPASEPTCGCGKPIPDFLRMKPSGAFFWCPECHAYFDKIDGKWKRRAAASPPVPDHDRGKVVRDAHYAAFGEFLNEWELIPEPGRVKWNAIYDAVAAVERRKG